MTGKVLENHWINVASTIIESLSLKPAFDKRLELPEKTVIIPALVNAHTHLELSQLKVPLDVPMRKMSGWVKTLLAFRRSAEYNAPLAIQSALQCLQNNIVSNNTLQSTAALGDIVPPNIEPLPVLPVSLPPSASLCPCWLAFVEWIGWRKDQIPDGNLKSWQYGVSPHAPQTLCPALLEKAVRMNVPVAMHLAETEEELQLLRSGTGPLLEMMRLADADYEPAQTLLGKRPLDYLQLLAQAPKAFIIHGNYLDDEELRFLAGHRETMSVVYCPRSHHYFRHKQYPLRKMLDYGVRVLLGTDSAASVPDIDLTNEIRFAAALHRNVPVEALYRSAALSGAEAFGLTDCGKIAAGYRAVFGVLY